MRIWKAKTPASEGNLLLSLLRHRGLKSEAEISAFLDPKFSETHDPFLLKDMDLAVDRIGKALQAQERITIYADYDADAVTAAAVLLRFFEHCGHKNLDYYIPDRFAEGYGVNPEAIKTLAERGSNLIITVDCGINAFDSVDLATYLGLDVIITDHHQLTGGIPRAVAVVNPHRPDDEYPFKDLTGVGVAFKLVQALVTSFQSSPAEGRMAEGQEGLNTSINPSPTLPSTGERAKSKITKGWEKWLLDLVAIGTVADCQSLLGENRIFVKWGLHVLQKTRWLGLQELLKLAEIWQNPLDTYKIGFIIAPRINAAGRIEHANLALELLLTNDSLKAQAIAQKLEELNRHRQQLTRQILSEAKEKILVAKDKKILLLSGENWPKGIVGLVASKLTEEFYRPVLILSQEAQEATGSARSIGSFNIVEAIGRNREILLRYGGHPMAAGFTLKVEHIELFHKNLLEYAEAVLTEEDLAPVLFYDAEISLDQISPELVAALEKFAPFGLGNPRPRLRLNNLIPQYVSAVGAEGKHLRMYVSSEGVRIGCIGFNLGFWAEKLQGLSKIDIICELQYNEWQGRKTIQARLVDIDLLGN